MQLNATCHVLAWAMNDLRHPESPEIAPPALKGFVTTNINIINDRNPV